MLKIEINKIIVIDRKRACDDAEAKKLAESIRQIGLMHPITLDKDLNLIAGLHRLEACKQLGWSEIPAIILDADSLTAELAEIDENLIRKSLTALENAEQLKRRKEIYEALHPESKPENIKSKNLPKRNLFVSGKVKTFTQDAAEKTGKSQRSIQQDIQIASNISGEVKQEIKGTEIENKKSALLEIAKQPTGKQLGVFETMEAQKYVVNKMEVNKNELDIAYKVDFVLKKVVVDGKWLELPPNYDIENNPYSKMFWDANNYNVKKQKELETPAQK